MQIPGGFTGLMVPRSVQSKKTHAPGYNNQRRKANKRKFTSTHSRHDQLRPDACSPVTQNDNVQAILTDMVDQSCLLMAQSLLTNTCNTLALNAVPISFVETMQMQPHAPYVYVGPITYNNQVPVYQRSRQEIPSASSMDHNLYTGLTWNPAVSRPEGNRHHTNSNNSVVSRYEGNRKHVNCNDNTQRYHPRQWEYTKAGNYYMLRPDTQRGFEFTVMSYNVLAQNLLEDNSYLYHHCQNDTLDWGWRKKRLLDELKYHSPDVICLQEVRCNHYTDFFLPELRKLGYDGAYIKRTGNKQDGCATFYSKHKFQCQQVILVPYCHQSGGHVLDRDNVGLIVKLKPLSTSLPADRQLIVANTHLLFNPRRGDVKLAQLMVLLAEIDKCGNTGGHPDMYSAVIMCGDFNSEPNSDIYKLILMGYLEYEGILIRDISGQKEDDGYRRGTNARLEKNFFPSKVGINDNCQFCDVVQQRQLHGVGNSKDTSDTAEDDVVVTDTQGSGILQHQLRFVSVYKHWLSRLHNRHKEVTTHHGRAACTLDYLFYGVQSGMVRYYHGEVETQNIQEGHLSLLARYGLLSDRELKNMGSLPNERYGSDHLSLISRFLLT